MAERSGGLVGTFKIDDGRKVQPAAWLMKDEASFWWKVTNGERTWETWIGHTIRKWIQRRALASTVVRWDTSLGTARRNEDKGRGQDQLLEGRRTLSRLVDRIGLGKLSVGGLISLSDC